MFGVGGGFILTPLLFFIGIPPAVAVASAANQIAGSSFSAFLAHLQPRDRRLQDGRWCCSPAACSAPCSASPSSPRCGAVGQIELVVSLLYVILLGTIGGLMLRRASARSAGAATPTPAGAAPPAHLGARPAAEDALPRLASSMSAPSRRS